MLSLLGQIIYNSSVFISYAACSKLRLIVIIERYQSLGLGHVKHCLFCGMLQACYQNCR